ncbi:MAG: toxin-antitoxin system YwqK family antitoxin, partial [Flavobacteriales bacterium]|nr:toxin-antitoxin system YwqK family antitoxin [Flavobacteriales bacterium]
MKHLLIPFLFFPLVCFSQNQVKEFYPSNKLRSVRTFVDSIPHGKSTEYYENGFKEQQGSFNHGKKDGEWREWYKNGKLWSLSFYKNGVPNGRYEDYDMNGGKVEEGVLLNGVPSGPIKTWYNDGSAR